MSASAVYNCQPFYQQGYGLRDYANRTPYTPQTVQSICSMSKAFTSVALMQLVEKGKLNIDQTMIELVPYFKLTDPRYKDITIRHLLGHNSGLPGLTDEDFYGEWVDPWTDDGAIERYVRSLYSMNITLSSYPGDPFNFIYSDMGYDILAVVIQEVSGEINEGGSAVDFGVWLFTRIHDFFAPPAATGQLQMLKQPPLAFPWHKPMR